MWLSGYKTRRNLTVFVVIVGCWCPILRGRVSFAFRTNHNVVGNSFRICYQMSYGSVENVRSSIDEYQLPQHHGCEVGALKISYFPYFAHRIISRRSFFKNTFFFFSLCDLFRHLSCSFFSMKSNASS